MSDLNFPPKFTLDADGVPILTQDNGGVNVLAQGGTEGLACGPFPHGITGDQVAGFADAAGVAVTTVDAERYIGGAWVAHATAAIQAVVNPYCLLIAPGTTGASGWRLTYAAAVAPADPVKVTCDAVPVDAPTIVDENGEEFGS